MNLLHKVHATGRWAGVVAIAVAAVVWVHRAWLWRAEPLLFGDHGDARFNVVVLEHWWRTLRGLEPAGSPGFFYPTPHVLGFSDAWLLAVPPYALARIVAMPVTAMQATLLALSVAGFVGAFLALRRIVRADLAVAAVGAALCTVQSGVVSALWASHSQLANAQLVPWLAVLAGSAFAEGSLLRRSASALGLGLLAALLLSTSFYVGWFAGLVILGVVVAALVMGALVEGLRPQAVRVARGLVAHRAELALAMVGALLGLAPFDHLYLPALHMVGPRELGDAEALLLTPWNALLGLGAESVLWGDLAPDLPSIEQRSGYGPLLWGAGVLALLRLLACAFGARRRRDALRPELLVGLAATLTWLVVTALVTRWSTPTAWSFVYWLVPGAKALRVPARALLITFPLTVCGLAAAVRTLSRRRATLAVTVLAATFLLAEQLQRVPMRTLGWPDDGALRADITAPPRACSWFYLASHLDVAGRDALPPVVAQVDAMLVAQNTGLPTVHGYSGHAPSGWHLGDVRAPGYRAAVRDWARAQRLVTGACAYDLVTKSFTVGLP